MRTHRVERGRRGRAGITLTEILISIMIMGVGVTSLATLFPLGLVRLRNAQRMSRSGFLVESAEADLASRNLVSKASFLNTAFSPWYVTASGQFDPWVQDTDGNDWSDGTNPLGVYRGGGGTGAAFADLPGPGLPVAYDPLWRAVTGVYPPSAALSAPPQAEARFASGIGWLRNDPNPGGVSSLPSAHGLQRVTNLFGVAPTDPRATPARVQTYYSTLQAFISPEDYVTQDPNGKPYAFDQNGNYVPVASPSPVVPDFTNATASLPSPTNDWRYTWMYTARQSDSSNGMVYDGDVVIFENRPFSFDQAVSPFGGTVSQAGGETVVEAVWGYGTTAPGGGSPFPYSAGANRSVLLRWPTTVPDPDVRVGGWIADVTYERSYAEQRARANLGTVGAQYPLQRCDWYQVSKKSEPAAAPGWSTDGGHGYRQMTVWVTTPLRAKTPMDFASGQPRHVEAALVAPGVANVYPRTVYCW
jgi:hypothetical protein